MCRLVPAAKVRVELPRLCTSWGTRNPRPGRSTMIFMIPKTKKPGGSMQGSTGIFRTHMQPPSHLPFCLPDLACHVVNSPTSLHDFSFSHILPVLGLAPVSRQVSSHLPPSSSAEMPQRLGARVRDQILTNLHPAIGFVWSLPRRMISPSQRLEVAAS